MKKTNKKLSISSQTIRALSGVALQGIAGAVPPNSQALGSACINCGETRSPVATCVSCFPCITQMGATCPTVCH